MPKRKMAGRAVRPPSRRARAASRRGRPPYKPGTNPNLPNAIMSRALAEEFGLAPHTAAGWVVLIRAEKFDVSGFVYGGPGGPITGVKIAADTMHAGFQSKTKHLAVVTDKLLRKGPLRERWAALDDVAAWRRVIRGFIASDWVDVNRALAELADRGWRKTFNELAPRVLAIAALGAFGLPEQP